MYKTIDLMKMANVGRETIRYYETRGLIKPVGRTPGGYKLYDEQTVDKIRFIKNIQKLDFTLNEIAELYTVLVNSDNPWGELIHVIENRLKNLNRQKTNLQKIKKMINKYQLDREKDNKTKRPKGKAIKQFADMRFQVKPPVR